MLGLFGKNVSFYAVGIKLTVSPYFHRNRKHFVILFKKIFFFYREIIVLFIYFEVFLVRYAYFDLYECPVLFVLFEFMKHLLWRKTQEQLKLETKNFLNLGLAGIIVNKKINIFSTKKMLLFFRSYFFFLSWKKEIFRK